MNTDKQAEAILENANGVWIIDKFSGHYRAKNAFCACGNLLIVAHRIFNAECLPDDPLMICFDHCPCDAYRFSSLIIGRQQ